MDPRHNLKAKLSIGKAERLEARRDHAKEQVSALVCALRLNGGAPVPADIMGRIEQHTQNGFPLPGKLMDALQKAVDNPRLMPDLEYVAFWLLEVAVMGLSPRSKKFAYSLIASHEANGQWSQDQFFWALRCLDEGRNTAREAS